MKNIPLLIGTIVGTLLLIVGVAFFFSSTQSTPETETQVVDAAMLAADARHPYGPEDAAVTIVEFSDFQCPSCRAASPLVKQVMNEYPEDVRVIYRHFPLGSFPYSQLAAQASEIAGENDLFWEYHDLLFQNQAEWSALRSEGAVRDIFVTYAGELGIDTEQFQEKIQSNEYQDEVLADRALGNSLNITGTPTLFVNGQRLSAPNQLPSLVEAIVNAEAEAPETSSEEELEATESAENAEPAQEEGAAQL